METPVTPNNLRNPSAGTPSDGLRRGHRLALTPRLLDAVTLRNFGIVEHLGVLKHLLSAYPSPYWTETVRSEILAGIGQADCDVVLGASFLGSPYQTAEGDLVEVMRIRIALGGARSGANQHLGEAESIWVADKLNGTFITDDHAAYEFASQRLGNSRVLDTVELLRESVVTNYFTSNEAQQVADAIRNNGRKLRRGHPQTFTAEYFEPQQ